jgi:hypothetical protein
MALVTPFDAVLSTERLLPHVAQGGSALHTTTTSVNAGYRTFIVRLRPFSYVDIQNPSPDDKPSAGTA